VDVTGYQLRFRIKLIEGGGESQRLGITIDGNADLVATAFESNSCPQVTRTGNFLSIDGNNDIADFYACFFCR